MAGSACKWGICPSFAVGERSRLVVAKPGPRSEESCHRNVEGRKHASVRSLIRLKGETRAIQDSSQGPTEPVFPHGFDLPTAVALAGCAFEAYLEPEGDDNWTATHSKGTTVTYTNREILSQHTDGFLEVTVKSATGVPAKDFTGKSDPYVHVSIGESSAQTKMCSQTLEPEWNETFLLFVRDSEKDVLRMCVRDYDFLKSDDELGTAMYPVKALKDGGVVDLSLDLQGSGGGGTLLMSARYILFEDHIPDIELESTSEWQNLGESFAATGLSKSWSELAVQAGVKAEERFDVVCYVENERTDSQAWIHCSDDKQRKEAVIAFRGTEQLKLKDILTDANLFPSTFEIESTEKLSVAADKLFSDPKHKLLVHKGFLDAYNSIKQSLFLVLHDMIGDGEEWTVYVTGHSLGGALATLCSFDLASRSSFSGKVEMYNYGSPRVGNKSFADAFNEMVPVSWRVANSKDIVITVPKLLGYRHVRNLVSLDGNDILSFGTDSLDISDDIDVDLEQAGKIRIRGKTQITSGMNIFSGVASGCKVGAHMEEQYFMHLCQCVSEYPLV